MSIGRNNGLVEKTLGADLALTSPPHYESMALKRLVPKRDNRKGEER